MRSTKQTLRQRILFQVPSSALFICFSNIPAAPTMLTRKISKVANMDYLFHIWRRICYNCYDHSPVILLSNRIYWVIIRYALNCISNNMGATCRARSSSLPDNLKSTQILFCSVQVFHVLLLYCVSLLLFVVLSYTFVKFYPLALSLCFRNKKQNKKICKRTI